MKESQLEELAKVSSAYLKSILEKDDTNGKRIEDTFTSDELLIGSMILNNYLVEFMSDMLNITDHQVLNIIESQIDKRLGDHL